MHILNSYILNSYISILSRLNRANTPYGKAPHKPILLLSLIELIEKGVVDNNRFYVNSDLVGTFQENWRLLVDTLHQPDFSQPFYYLQSEKSTRLPMLPPRMALNRFLENCSGSSLKFSLLAKIVIENDS